MPEATQKLSKRHFYRKALNAAEQAGFEDALGVEGLQEEVAALRLRLRTALEAGPDDFDLVLRGMEILRRMVATRYGLSKADEHDLDSAFVRETARRMRERGGDCDDVDA